MQDGTWERPPLHGVDAHRGVEEHVAEVVVQEVDLVDVGPRFASASSPGWSAAMPSRSARAMSTEPATRSSVALSGRLTMRTRRATIGSSPAARRSAQSAHGSAGSQEKGQSATTSISGSGGQAAHRR